jgi:hypothetical protein
MHLNLDRIKEKGRVMEKQSKKKRMHEKKD